MLTLASMVKSVSGYGYSSSIDIESLTVKELFVLASLPHGSGIDYDWHVGHRTDGRLVAYNAYHGMNECGMYVGSVDFSIVYEKDFSDFRIVFHSNSAGWYWIRYWDLRNYLGDTIAYALSEGLDALSKAW